MVDDANAPEPLSDAALAEALEDARAKLQKYGQYHPDSRTARALLNVESRLRLAEAALGSRSPVVPLGNLLECGYCHGNGYAHTTGIEHHADCTYMAWRAARAAEEDPRGS